MRTLHSQKSILRHIPGHSAIFTHVPAYWGPLRHIEAYLGITDVYGEIIRTLCNHCIYRTYVHAIFRTGLFRTRCIFKSLSTMSDVHAYSEPWHSQNSLFRHFQKYLDIYRDIDAYSATLTDAQLQWRGGYWCIFSHTHRRSTPGERRGIHCPFWKSKKVSWFWRERPWLCPSLG